MKRNVKKVISVLLCMTAIFVLSPAAVSAAYIWPYAPGDVNCDGKITASDARTVLRIGLELEAPATDKARELADTNFDGKITVTDARITLRIALGLQPRTDEIVIEVGGYRISKNELTAFMNDRAFSLDESVEARTVAYQIAAHKLAETELIGTEYESSADEYMEITVRNQLESFERNEKENLEFCASLGVSREELIDSLIATTFRRETAAKHLVLIYEDLSAYYEEKYKAPLEITLELLNIYNEYMFERVKDLSYKELEPEAVRSIAGRAAAIHDSYLRFRGANSY